MKLLKEVILILGAWTIAVAFTLGLIFGSIYTYEVITYPDKLELVERCEATKQLECSPGTVRDESAYECQCDHQETGQDINWRIPWE